MRKVFLALMCMASLVIMTACGGGNAKNDTSEGTAKVVKEVKALKGGERWADHDITIAFPAPPKDKIANKITSKELSYSINMTWTKEEAEAYIETCKKTGFTKVIVDSGTNLKVWQAKNADGDVVNLSYYTANGKKGGMLQLRKQP